MYKLYNLPSENRLLVVTKTKAGTYILFYSDDPSLCLPATQDHWEGKFTILRPIFLGEYKTLSSVEKDYPEYSL